MDKTGKTVFEFPTDSEPCFFEKGGPAALADLTVEIQRAADGLGQVRCISSATPMDG